MKFVTGLYNHTLLTLTTRCILIVRGNSSSIVFVKTTLFTLYRPTNCSVSFSILFFLFAISSLLYLVLLSLSFSICLLLFFFYLHIALFFLMSFSILLSLPSEFPLFFSQILLLLYIFLFVFLQTPFLDPAHSLP